MKKVTFAPSGVCCKMTEFEIDDNNKLHNVVFTAGCNGNLKGIAKLVEGMDAQHVADLLEGNTCGNRPTSCPDQLSKAIKENL